MTSFGLRVHQTVGLWPSLVLSLLAGAVLPFAFAPYHVTWLAPVALSILFALWSRSDKRGVMLQGYLFGLGMFTAGIYWVYISIHQFGHVPLGMSIFLCVLFIAFLAIFPTLAAYLYFRLRSYVGPGAQLLGLPAIWVLVEWVRGWFLTGFPWLAVGYSQTTGPLAGVAPVLGVYGLSWVVAQIAVLIVVVMVGLQWRRSALGMLVLIVAAGMGLGQIEWTHPVSGPIKVSLVQGNIPQDIKWLPSVRKPTLELYRELTLDHWDSDLIIWPESAVPMFLDEAKPFLDELGREARAHNADLLTGIIAEDRHSGQYYNTVIALGDDSGMYAKRHLVPFTEYLPLKSILGSIVAFMDVPMSDFSAGDAGQAPLSAAGIAVGVSICYEDAFGEEMIDRLPVANVLVNVSNDAWFGGSVAPWQHLQMAQMRALETGRPMLRATNTGVTAIVAADGHIQAAAPQFKAAVLTGQVQPRQGMTPYAYWGNAPVVAILLAILCGLAVARCRAGARESLVTDEGGHP